MSNKKQYIEIEKRMTLNLWKDGVSDTRENREFQSLKNYIPAQGEIRTREGITLFTHTPDSTITVWEPTSPDQTYELPPGDFATIWAVFPFNSTATIGNELLSGDLVYSALGATTPQGLTESGKCTVYNSDKVEGAGCLIMTDDTVANTWAGEPNISWGMRTLNAFPAYMPGETSNTLKKFLITYWIKPFNANAGADAEWHFTFGNDGDKTKLAFGIRHFDQNLQTFWADSAGNSILENQIDDIVVEDQWQFIAAWCDGDTNFSGLYHYNASTLVEEYTSNTTLAVVFDHFYTHGTANTINAKYIFSGGAQRTDQSDAYHGLLDYCTMWNQPMHVNNSSNITLVRAIRDMAWLL